MCKRCAAAICHGILEATFFMPHTASTATERGRARGLPSASSITSISRHREVGAFFHSGSPSPEPFVDLLLEFFS